jgi:hypothetical protein
MKITVIGATGMIGSRVVAEAVRRGHDVTAISRSVTSVEGASACLAMQLNDTNAVLNAIKGSDAMVFSVSPDRAGDHTSQRLRPIAIL